MVSKSRIIKANSPGVLPRGKLHTFHVNDVLAEARQTMLSAHEEAARIIEQARQEAEAIREAARQEGYQAGLAQGTAQGIAQGTERGRQEALAEATQEFQAQQASLVESCRKLIAEIEAHRAEWVATARQDLIELAMAIARRIVRHVGERDREVVLANLEEAIRLAGRRTDVTIAINPADAAAAKVFAKSLSDLHEGWEHVTIVQEPEISPGGCRVQWGSGAIDATLETQLERIEMALRSAASADEGT